MEDIHGRYVRRFLRQETRLQESGGSGENIITMLMIMTMHTNTLKFSVSNRFENV